MLKEVIIKGKRNNSSNILQILSMHSHVYYFKSKPKTFVLETLLHWKLGLYFGALQVKTTTKLTLIIRSCQAWLSDNTMSNGMAFDNFGSAKIILNKWA